jgi:hypothetical protein
MSVPEPREIWQEVLAWLRVARSDQRVARICIAVDPPARDVAAFHLPTGGGEASEGISGSGEQRFWQDPRFERLGRVVVSHFPSVASFVSARDDWTGWNIAYR